MQSNQDPTLWPSLSESDGAPPAAPDCAAPAQDTPAAPPPPPPAAPLPPGYVQYDPVRLKAAQEAQKANREARKRAQMTGAPELERDILMNTGVQEPPEVPGYGRPCRMTCALRQIMVRWSKLPADCLMPDLTCLALCFLRPRRAWALLSAYDESTLQWAGETDAEVWRNEVMGLALTLTEHPPELSEELMRWINGRVQDFFGSPGENPGSKESRSRPPEPEAAPDGGCAPCTP